MLWRDPHLGRSGRRGQGLPCYGARRAVDAFDTYGKGRGHPAQLNFADCLSYACAAHHNVPILFKGRDFIHTDLGIAS